MTGKGDQLFRAPKSEHQKSTKEDGSGELVRRPNKGQGRAAAQGLERTVRCDSRTWLTSQGARFYSWRSPRTIFAACGSSAAIAASDSAAPLGLPGRLTMSAAPRTPTTERESTARGVAATP